MAAKKKSADEKINIPETTGISPELVGEGKVGKKAEKKGKKEKAEKKEDMKEKETSKEATKKTEKKEKKTVKKIEAENIKANADNVEMPKDDEKKAEKTHEEEINKKEKKEPKIKKPELKLSEADIAKLSGQAEVSIGLIGHVDHGKTTLTERLTGKWTDTHSEEIKRGITIRLGYADIIFRKCPDCPEPECYTTKDMCPKCGSTAHVLRKLSFVDAPGHESLMATMLAGATIMDGALLLVAANENCPQPQTREHLMALQIMGIKNVVVIQNKIDLVSRDKAIKNYQQIKEFLNGTGYENAPIIPISAVYGLNISLVIKAIEKNIPTPERDSDKDPVMFVARSFDINKPGTKTDNIKGGVLGGSLAKGILKTGQDIEIRPGIPFEEKNQKIWKPIFTKIVSIAAGSNIIQEAGPGGSIAVMTMLDPSIVKSDKLTGSLVGIPGKLPPVHYEINLKVNLLERVVGTKENLEVKPLAMNESLMLNVNSASTVGIVTNLHKGIATCKLKLPVCAEIGARITISRLIGNRFRLIGYGIIQ